MLKENWRLVSRVERLGDWCLILGCFFIAYQLRFSVPHWSIQLGLRVPLSGPMLAPLKDYVMVLLVALGSYSLFLNALGAYSSMRLSSVWRLVWVAVVSSLMVFFTLGAVLFALKIDLSRSFIGIFCALVAASLVVERWCVLQALRFWRRRGKNFRNVLICGCGEQALRLVSEIQSRPELGISIRAFGVLNKESSSLHQAIDHFKQTLRNRGFERSVRVLVERAAVERALKEYAIDEVIFTDFLAVIPEVEQVMFACSDQGIRTTVAADLFSLGMIKSGLSYFGGMPLIHFQTPPGDGWQLGAKRVIDVVISIFLLVVFAPIFGLIALLVRLSSPGPIIFSQRRVGLNGRIFWLYKFRSMDADAEARIQSLQQKNEMSGPVFKIADDPRITAVGRWLRRFSLDELPQLWNVLKGDMSLVGPRPPVPGEVSLYERKDRRRLSMRPGLTCTWQVSGRNNIKDFETWVRLDLEYIDNWSLARDLVLMWRTVPAVLLGVGAR